ncbi:MAG: hypothetical protein R3E79_22930 [Caldilineaceae bacterium]
MTTITTSTTERFVRCIAATGDPLSITPGQYYQVIPDPVEVDSMLRIIDNPDEDYLYDADLFEESTDLGSLHAELLIVLTVPMEAAILQIASQRGISMAALLREWIGGRLALPVNV